MGFVIRNISFLVDNKSHKMIEKGKINVLHFEDFLIVVN